MMSLFRPTPVLKFDGFVPTPTGETKAFSAGRTRSTTGSASEAVANEVPTDKLLSDVEIAALEQAAFDRGVESQAVDRTRFDHACEVLSASAAEWEARIETLRVGAPNEIVEMALAVARQWVGESVEADATRFVSILENALELCREQAPRQLFLNIEDLKTIERENPDVLGDWKQSAGLEVAADDAVGRSEFRIEATRGVVDGRFDAVLSRLQERLATAEEPVE